MPHQDIALGVVVEETALTLEDLAAATSVSAEWIRVRVELGVLPVPHAGPDQWRFSSRDLWRVRQLRALERDFDAVPELAALVTDLLEEIHTLRGRLRRAGLG
jgi:chaperone modulatory protein CbpM